MDLFTRITSLGRVTKLICFLSILFITNSVVTIASEKRSNFSYIGLKDNDFEKIYKLNSIPFEEYDFYENQIRTFLGFYSIESEKSFFQDFLIMNDSKSIRELYKAKLNDMTINKKINIIKR